MSRLRYVVGTVLLALVLIGFFQASYSVATVAFMSWVDYKQPYKPDVPSVPLLEEVMPLGNHVVIVVIDGARPDIVERANTPNIDWVRDSGVWFKNARSFTPSLSLPGFASIATGAKPSIAGVTSNWQELHGDIGVDNIFKIVREHDEITAVAGSPAWMNLYGKWVSVNRTVQGETLNMDSIIGEYAVNIIEQYKPKLLIIHLYDTDNAGHRFGALSDEYRRQIEEADAEIGKIINTMDKLGILNETLFIVMSDHGFHNRFHHGGWEEEVLHILFTMRGPSVKRTEVSEEVLQDEIAATVSFFLGYRLPTALTGGILFDIFDVNEKRRAIYQISLAEIKFKQLLWFKEQFALGEAYDDKILKLEGELARAKQLFSEGKYGNAVSVAEKLEEDCEGLIAKVKEEKHLNEVSSRQQTILLIYANTLTPLIVITFILRKKIDWLTFSVAVICALGYFLGFWIAFLANGWYFSISLFDAVEQFQDGTMKFTIVGLIVAGIVTGLASKWVLKKENRWIKIILAALTGLVLVAVANLIYPSIYYVQWNYILDWYFPEGLSWGNSFAYYLMLMQNVYIPLFSGITPVIALATLSIVNKLLIKKISF